MKIRFTYLLLAATILTVPLHAQQKTKKAKPVNPAMVKVEDAEGLPRVLLIGDSISIGYTVGVRELLEGKANVHRPLTNCGPTTRGVASLDQWLKTGGEDKKWDVIHFNWGLHDLKYMTPQGGNLGDPKDPKNKPQVSQEDYEKNLTELVKRLKATGAQLIWRNTTPVPAGSKGRVVGDSKAYNTIAAKIMEKNEIPVHDLYSPSLKQMKELMLPANVHFTKAGSRVLSELVAERIIEALEAAK